MEPKFITVHDTANTNRGADAEAHAAYLKGDSAANAPVSWHFTVDNKKIVQHLPTTESGYHAGDGNGPGNRSSIGVEICENVDGDRAKAEANAAKLIARLKSETGSQVVQHNHWTGKNCPRVIRSRPNGWKDFLKKVESFMGETLTPIMGTPVATIDQAREWLKKKAPDWGLMADLCYSIAPKYGVRADVALAQAVKETGAFRFQGIVKAWQNNFCGLGATGVAATGQELLRGADPNLVSFEQGIHGAIFFDRATGVEAHLQHLYAYATDRPLPLGVVLLDPRFALVKRGAAPYAEHLGAKENPAGTGWAWPGVDYGHSIVRDYLADLVNTKIPEPISDAEKAMQRLLDEEVIFSKHDLKSNVTWEEHCFTLCRLLDRLAKC